MINASEAAHNVQCPTTQWTTIIEAVRSSNEDRAAQALKVFCEQYRDVIFLFFLRRVGPDLADTYTQEFFLRRIHRGWGERRGLLFSFEREEGKKFRHFLVSSLSWFCSVMRNTGTDSLTDSTGELPQLPDSDFVRKLTQDCDKEVALGLIRRVTKRLKISAPYLEYFCRQISAEEGARELAMSDGAFRVAVSRMVPAIRQAFRDEVRTVVASDAEVDDEGKYLIRIIAECNVRTAIL
jgi:hypothetical protein